MGSDENGLGLFGTVIRLQWLFVGLFSSCIILLLVVFVGFVWYCNKAAMVILLICWFC